MTKGCQGSGAAVREILDVVPLQKAHNPRPSNTIGSSRLCFLSEAGIYIWNLVVFSSIHDPIDLSLASLHDSKAPPISVDKGAWSGMRCSLGLHDSSKTPLPVGTINYSDHGSCSLDLPPDGVRSLSLSIYIYILYYSMSCSNKIFCIS